MRNKYNSFEIQIVIFSKIWKTWDKGVPLSNYSFFFQGYKRKLFSSFVVEILISYIYIKCCTRIKYNLFEIITLIFSKIWKTNDKGGPLTNYSFFFSRVQKETFFEFRS